MIVWYLLLTVSSYTVNVQGLGYADGVDQGEVVVFYNLRTG